MICPGCGTDQTAVLCPACTGEELKRLHLQLNALKKVERDQHEQLEESNRLNRDMREFVEKHSTCLGNICRFDGSHRCHEVIVAQMNGYTEKRKCEATTGTNNDVRCVNPHGHDGSHSDGILISWR